MSNRNGTKDIWTARRVVTTDPWPAPTLVTELSSAATDYSPGISLDGLQIWFATDRDTTRGRIWHATRATRSDPWLTPTPVSELASGSIDFAPVVDAAETTMAFTSNRPGGGGYDIYFTTRASTADPWGAAVATPGAVNGASDEYDPFVSSDDLVLFFTSMRSGMGDIYWTARRSIDDPFQEPTLMTELDSADYDSDSTLSPDLTYMMFSSTRSGNAEIYETTTLSP
jgi:Tol biopolymer transport system component